MQNGGVTLWFAAPALGALMFAAPATAQDYPTRPIRMVVPQAAGSASDTVARIIAGELTTRLKQQVIVDNRPGGALQLGLEIAAKSPPDGYTIAYGMIGALAINAALFAASLVAFLWLLAQLMTPPWFSSNLGVASPSTAMALVLFFIVVPSFTFLFSPLSSYYSRKHEFEADRYATEQTAAADLVTALVKLYKDNAATLTPDPLHSLFYDSHPPATARIARLKGAAA